jgi:hypothetical protein
MLKYCILKNTTSFANEEVALIDGEVVNINAAKEEGFI